MEESFQNVGKCYRIGGDGLRATIVYMKEQCDDSQFFWRRCEKMSEYRTERSSCKAGRSRENGSCDCKVL